MQLNGLRTKRIPIATNHLREARSNLEAPHDHLNGADQEITRIIAELNKVIEGTNTILVDDLLLKQIRELIKTEEFMQRQTNEWARKSLLNKEAAKVDQGRLSRAQQAVIDRYGLFFQTLVKARKEAADEETLSRFGRTELSLLESKPVAHMARAIDQIAQDKGIGAVTDQEKALEALREAEKILAASEEGSSDLVSELAEILADQKDLQQDVLQADDGAFRTEQSQFEARELEIGIKIAEVADSIPATAASNPSSPNEVGRSPRASARRGVRRGGGCRRGIEFRQPVSGRGSSDRRHRSPRGCPRGRRSRGGSRSRFGRGSWG